MVQRKEEKIKAINGVTVQWNDCRAIGSSSRLSLKLVTIVNIVVAAINTRVGEESMGNQKVVIETVTINVEGR
ncbi:hypothetical protein TYRP_020067 [Tyrophagus putrescentiae]|nr:hypothetical protein TYRP_020067 [Tyrophagus putrescentiae]